MRNGSLARYPEHDPVVVLQRYGTIALPSPSTNFASMLIRVAHCLHRVRAPDGSEVDRIAEPADLIALVPVTRWPLMATASAPAAHRPLTALQIWVEDPL